METWKARWRNCFCSNSQFRVWIFFVATRDSLTLYSHRVVTSDNLFFQFQFQFLFAEENYEKYE